MAAADFRDRLLAGLGGKWPDPCPLNARVLKTDKKDGYRIETIRYDAEPDDAIPALLLVPDDVTAARPAPDYSAARHLLCAGSGV